MRSKGSYCSVFHTELPTGLLAVLLTVLVSYDSAAGQGYLTPAKRDCLVSWQNAVLQTDFVRADSISRVLTSTAAADPAGLFCRGATCLALMIDREQAEEEAEFRAAMDSAQALAADVLDTCNDQVAAWMHLLRGHTYTYRAIYEGRFGSWWQAYRCAQKGQEEYLAGLDRDSSLHDLLLGLGSIQYWRSAKAGLLRKVGLVADNRQLGIDLLQEAQRSSIISREAAWNALIWIRLDQKQYDSAAALCRSLLDRFPESRMLRWPLAQALFGAGAFREASGLYEELRREYVANPGNYYNVIECDYYLAQCCEQMRDAARLRQAARRVRDYVSQVPSDTARRQRDKLDFLKRTART